jgi:hypothetical protein
VVIVGEVGDLRILDGGARLDDIEVGLDLGNGTAPAVRGESYLDGTGAAIEIVGGGTMGRVSLSAGSIDERPSNECDRAVVIVLGASSKCLEAEDRLRNMPIFLLGGVKVSLTTGTGGLVQSRIAARASAGLVSVGP